MGGEWIIVPAYDEASVIAAVVAELRQFTSNVVVVDDCSSDTTPSEAAAAGAIVLRHIINRGQGAAIQTGLDYALLHGASAMATFDADGQHDVADLRALFAPIHRGGADFALGSRFAGRSDVPPLRKLTLKLAVIFTRLTAGLDVTDAHNGLRAFSRRGAESIHIRLDRMAHASEIMDQIRASGLAYVEVPVRVRYTEYARRKGQRGVQAFRVALDYLLGRWLR